ncbi:MAG: response regulator [bacterium]
MSKRVLIASDDLSASECISELLNEERFNPVYATQASHVLLNLLDMEFDLLILDLDLAGMNGLEMLPIIRRVRPNLPIIVITNDNSFETGRSIATQGIWLHLLKPINVDKLETFLNYMLMRNFSK